MFGKRKRIRKRIKRRVRRRVAGGWGPRALVRRMSMRLTVWGVGVMMWGMRRTLRRLLRAAFLLRSGPLSLSARPG